MPIKINQKKAPAVEIKPAPLPEPAPIPAPDPTAELMQKMQAQNQAFLDALSKELTKPGKKVITAKVIRGADRLIDKIQLEIE